MLLCAKPINTPHTKEPRAAPGAGNCIQNWSWLRGRYNHTTQENEQRKYKNAVVKEACRHATYKGARGDPCHRKLHPKVRPVAPSRRGLLYSRHMSPNLCLCEGICRYGICTDVNIFGWFVGRRTAQCIERSWTVLLRSVVPNSEFRCWRIY